MFIEEAITAHLRDNAALTALIGTGGIYHVTLNQNASLPALVYSKVSSVPTYTHDGSSGLVESRFQISCLAKTYETVKELSAAVKKAMRPLESGPVKLSGVNIGGAFLENETDLYVASDAEPASRYHIPQDWIVQHSEDFD